MPSAFAHHTLHQLLSQAPDTPPRIPLAHRIPFTLILAPTLVNVGEPFTLSACTHLWSLTQPFLTTSFVILHILALHPCKLLSVTVSRKCSLIASSTLLLCICLTLHSHVSSFREPASQTPRLMIYGKCSFVK